MIPDLSEGVSCDLSPKICFEETDDDLEDDDPLRSLTYSVLFILLRTSHS